MEETRSFGYICPKCGRAVMARRSAFSLAAAAAHIECPCGESDMLIETDGSKFRMWVPCGLCGETHQAECSAEAVLHGRGIGLACPKTRQICCYDCGGKLRLPAATDEDLDRLCCQMTLTIPGRA